jgi:enoyl-CoA hydratase/carnithine racemase
MGYETLFLVKQGNVAVLTLNHPPTNSISYVMLQELDKVFNQAANDMDVRVTVITGAGDTKVWMRGSRGAELRVICAKSKDVIEGFSAFMLKRKPEFKGE